MDYKQMPPPKNSIYGNQANPGSSLTTAALVLGIISLTSLICIYPPLIAGGLSITFALLSKGKGSTITLSARIGMTLSIVAIIISTLILIGAIIYTFSNPELMKQSIELYEQMLLK